jgi:hypothetical protein
MNPNLERDLLKLRLKSDAELARLIRKADLQGRFYALCWGVVTLLLVWLVWRGGML